MRAIISYLVLAIGVALAIAGSVMLGVGISRSNSSKDCSITNAPPSKAQTTLMSTTTRAATDSKAISQMIQSRIDPDRIKQNLRDFTKLPHMAGTDNNAKVRKSIVEKYIDAGLENVHTVKYNVLLSYPPDAANPNLMTIEDYDGKAIFTSEGISPPIVLDEQSDKGAGIQWVAFSPSGTVVGDVVYCGFATEKEFQILQSHGINVKNTIALIRYGSMFRGDQVATAQKYGAIGAILYSDPAEVAPNGTADGSVYAGTVYMPAHGVQRGTVITQTGDVQSPLYPSKPNLWRAGSVEQARKDGILPSIPVMPISYSSAKELFSRLGGPAAPEAWKGGLNVPYNLGPRLTNGFKTRISVGGHFEEREIQNVIGYIKGAEEPERYVILGNHYDAWTYGAMDPNAGTAVLAEVARATVEVMSQTDWRPARSIMFAAWDAEEYGLVGSTEFVEEFAEILTRRAVAYINQDCFKGNTTLYLQSSPSLQDQAIQAAKNVQNPRKDEIAANRSTVYDTWLYNMKDPKYPDIPDIGIPMGVPSVNFAFIDMDKHHTYPLYHTLYETPFTTEHLMDTDNFAMHRAMGQFWIELAVQIADAPTIPYSLTTLATKIERDYITDLAGAIMSLDMTSYTDAGYKQLKQMANTAQKLVDACGLFESFRVPRTEDVLFRSRYNDKLINFERCFVNPRGVPGDPAARHLLFSVSKSDSYSSSVMQQVYKVLNDMADASTGELPSLRDELANQISIVHNSLLCGMNVLADEI
ncbi:unnamed protein product [Cylicocyclus nassatus]|uniref:Uncharacterized protein n=1 Tax=Cylicocyclus nassatus TaxID=53992 RepID=A0AA36H886_CYLNA|nr:unnamed protein product [Cylicocyclus nassatus]